MVKRDHLNQVGRKFTTLGEEPAAFAVSESEYLFLRFVQGNSFCPGKFKDTGEFLRQYPQVDDDSYVVQQAGKIGFPGICKPDLAGKMTGDQSASQRMLPENDRIHSSTVSRHQVEHSARHGNIADPLKSEADDRSAQ